MKYPIHISPYGTQAVLISWPVKIDRQISDDIHAFAAQLKGIQTIQDTIIAYHSLTITYKHPIKKFSTLQKELIDLYEQPSAEVNTSKRCWFIPVCYAPSFGIDLAALAQAKNLSVDEVIALHTTPRYTLHFIGFIPGFLYLGGLNTQLHTPRRAVPRLEVQRGAVAIGGEQTGIYPSESAGGWHIIGQTPISFFNRHQKKPCFASPGDEIQFVPISKEQYTKITADELPKFEWL